MTKILTARDVTAVIEKAVPSGLQEEWDNSGIQLGFMDSTVSTIMTCLELDEETVYEAIEKEAEMIVTHHPLIFGGISKISDCDPQGRIIQKLLAAGITVYSSHTPYDKVKGGNNDILAKRLSLKDIKLLPDGDDICRMGLLPKAMSFRDMIFNVADSFDLNIRQIRAAGDPEMEIRKVAICSGAGSEYAKQALEADCQALITGDVKHHEAQDAVAMGLCIIDAGHYGTEKFFGEEMKLLLEKNLPSDVEIFVSETITDPFIQL